MPAATIDNVPDRDDLNDDQARLVDAALSSNAGLFVQASVPGSGKTYAASRLIAEYGVDRAAAGETQPLVGLVVAAFNRDTARDLVPEIATWIRWLIATDGTDAAAALDADDAAELITAVRRSQTVGTIDALLQRVFDDIATELGFDRDVTVADDYAANQLHAEALAAIRADPELTNALDRLERAYPQVKRNQPDRLASILKQLFTAARNNHWSADDVRARLLEGRHACYPDGPAETIADIERDLRRFDDREATVTDSDLHCPPTALVGADQRLYNEWGDRIEDLTRVYRAYVSAYDRLSREMNTVSHTDRTYWVARYFTDPECAHRYADGTDHTVVAARRERLRDRWRSQIDLLVIDEAQDVSTGQHDALTPLVDADTRVVLYGDAYQSIYTWRSASPTLFGAAIADGEYLGRQWDTHDVETATTTYRQRPALTRTVNATFGEALSDDRRGVTPAVAAHYDDLLPDRAPSDDPSIHIATFDPPTSRPSSSEWYSNEGGSGCVDALADYIRGALASGQFDDPDSISPILVLFRSSAYMDIAREAFEGAGLSVGIEHPVFDSGFVQAAVAVLSWLVDPTDVGRTEQLLTASPIAPDDDECGTLRTSLATTVAQHDWDIVAAAASQSAHGDQLDELADLASDRAERHRCSAGALTRRVCRLLDPHEDPFEVDPDTASRRRCRLRDSVVEVANSLDGADVSLATVVSGLESLVASPDDGPILDIEPDDHDVVFRTAHKAKGDEAPVVALADPGRSARNTRLHRNSVIAYGETLAVCPPRMGEARAAATHSLDGYPNGLFDEELGYERKTSGLRWTSSRSRRDDSTGTRVAGPARFADIAAAKRAEEWRLGYVAATRARDHLVLPIERDVERDPTRSWAHALASTHDIDAIESHETAHVAVEGTPTAVSVDDAPGRGPVASHPSWESTTRQPVYSKPTAVTTDEQRMWLPRFLNPSTFWPLVEDHERYVLDHLRHAQLDTVSGDLDSDLPISFETVPPGRVGRIAHDAIASVVRDGLWADELKRTSQQVTDSVRWACTRYETQFEMIPNEEREQLVEYLSSTVLPQFADSSAFHRIARADNVYIEEPIETVVRVNGADLEIRGQADFVLQNDGEWSIEDLKLAFTEGRPATDERYRVQLATYRWVLATQQGRDPTTIDATATHLGTRASEVTSVGEHYDAAFITDLLDRLGASPTK